MPSSSPIGPIGARGYRGRFAPSPTGPLHAGSLAAALASWLDARAHGGVWLVRIEDLDPPREVPGAARDILETLAAFGMASDEPVEVQSRRGGHYEAAFSRLLGTSAGIRMRLLARRHRATARDEWCRRRRLSRHLPHRTATVDRRAPGGSGWPRVA